MGRSSNFFHTRTQYWDSKLGLNTWTQYLDPMLGPNAGTQVKSRKLRFRYSGGPLTKPTSF